MLKESSTFGLFVMFVLTFGVAYNAGAQSTDERYPTDFAQTGMAFLKIDVGARQAALASTNISVQGSVNDMFSNPAGLAFINGFDATTTVTNWIADIKHYGGGVAYQVGNLGTFGFSFVMMDYGRFVRTVPFEGIDPVLRNQGYLEQGTFTVNEYAFGLSFARQITSQFYVGGHVRYASQDLGDVTIFDQLRGVELLTENAISNIVFDFGTLYYTGWKDLRFGMSVRNFSNQSDYYDQRFELPLMLDIGMAVDILPVLSTTEDQSLTLLANWLHPRVFDERLHLGAEYGFMDMFFLRGGYKFNYDEESLTAGLGTKVSIGHHGLRADYAYAAFGNFFGQVHRVTIGVFGL